MNKKLILLMALSSGISVVAMEHLQKKPILQEASHHEEELLVNICLSDSVNPATPHEVAIPLRLAKLIGALNELVEDPHAKGSVFPLSNVTIAIWRLIEPHLERVYRVTHDESQDAHLREAIMTEFCKLDVKNLIEVICASDYLEIPILLESAFEVVKQSAPSKISWEELEVLPRHIGNQIIMNKVIMLLGPVPAKALDFCLGHERMVSSVCVTKDGKIVSGSSDSTVRVWDMEGNQLAVCRGHEDEIHSVCVMKDGKIVSGSDDETVRIWDMQGNEFAVCRGHEASVLSVWVTQDGKIVSGSDDETVRIWDMQGNEFAICRGHEASVLSVCVTQDGKIVSGSSDSTVRVWDMEGNQLAVCRGHENMISSVCVTQEGKIVSGSYDGTARIWDMQGNQLAICRGHEREVWSVCVTKDGKIVSGSLDRTVRVWDMHGNHLAICGGHSLWVNSFCVTKDGKIVSGSEDRTVRVWDMQGNQLAVCRGHEGSVRSVCVMHDGRIVSGSEDKMVRVWNSELLDSIVDMDEDRARALWVYVRKLPSIFDKQACWREIEKILGEDAHVAPAANINNNNNE